MMRGEMRVFADPAALARAVAEHLAGRIIVRVAERGTCGVVLSGGQTPQAVYRALAEVREVPWESVRVFWGDERWVSGDHADNNARRARESLLSRVPIPPENVHPIPTDAATPEEAARAYVGTLARWMPGGEMFDLMLLGLGRDGHTASLFPGGDAVREADRLVVAARAPVEPPLRITLTLPAINRSREIHVIVAGADKADALRTAASGPQDPVSCPASGVSPIGGGPLIWWVDAAAACGCT